MIRQSFKLYVGDCNAFGDWSGVTSARRQGKARDAVQRKGSERGEQKEGDEARCQQS